MEKILPINLKHEISLAIIMRKKTITGGGGTALYTANTVYAVYIHYLKFRF